jgi:hypothetical protein
VRYTCTLSLKLRVLTIDPVYVEDALADSEFQPEVFMHDREKDQPSQGWTADRRITFTLGLNQTDENLPHHEDLGQVIDTRWDKPTTKSSSS